MKEKLTPQYNDAVKQIKTAILQSQSKALASVNQEQLALYYGIGRYISQNSRSGFWGKDAIEAISRQLSAELPGLRQLSLEMPGLRGFSPRNLRNMRMFYEQWRMLDTNLADASAKLEQEENENTLMPTVFSNIPIAAFFSIGFSHHVMILSKTKTLEERKFYIQLCADLQLSHEALGHRIAEDAYHNQGKMPNNFVNAIPDYKQAFQAIQMFKDSYLLDFINTEQLGQREEDIDERVIENEIVHNMRNFIMTFGKGFAYIGCQVHFDKLGHDHWVDLLFFNRILRSLVVVELKKGTFKPSYLGQLSHYLHVLDDDERIEGENPPVGIILCKDADKTFVEYVLQDYQRPMGVATYQTRQKKLMELLPNEEEMKKLL